MSSPFVPVVGMTSILPNAQSQDIVYPSSDGEPLAQGLPRLRVAPDVMVIFEGTPGDRDNYKIWEEGQVPAVIFEMTSEGTRAQDQEFKKTLYEQREVQEYWLFDPKGEWIAEQLRGYRLLQPPLEPK